MDFESEDTKSKTKFWRYSAEVLVEPVTLTALVVPAILTNLIDNVEAEDFDVQAILTDSMTEVRPVGQGCGWMITKGPKILLCKDRTKPDHEPAAFLTIRLSDTMMSMRPTDVDALTPRQLGREEGHSPSSNSPLFSLLRDHHDLSTEPLRVSWLSAPFMALDDGLPTIDSFHLRAAVPDDQRSGLVFWWQERATPNSKDARELLVFQSLGGTSVPGESEISADGIASV